MDYEVFKWALLEEVRSMAPKGTRVRLRLIPKNNDVPAEGICLENDEDHFSPVIYLKALYVDFCRGMTLGEVARSVLESHRHAMEDVSAPMEGRPAYATVKDRLYCRLINTEMNQAFLEKVPHVRMLDLSIIFYYEVYLNARCPGTVTVRREDCEAWEVTTDDLYELALSNACRKKGLSFEDILQMIGDMGGPQMPVEPPVPLYVLTNETRVFGASAILYPGTLDMISARLKDDYYVLPSSIHELLILPAAQAPPLESVKHMVASVNSTEVLPEEVLSDSVYYYNVAKGRLTRM
ncbi:MAG: DUF5688 family protein [Lachnospiraceae bacterium]|nr:DUF5688 family protein [Lachnospiraceae bacterium]